MNKYSAVFKDDELKDLFIEWFVDCGYMDEFINYAKIERDVNIKIDFITSDEIVFK